MEENRFTFDTLERYKGSTFAAHLSDGRTMYLHADIITDWGIREGLEVSRSELRAIIYASNFRRAYQRALYLLALSKYIQKVLW